MILFPSQLEPFNTKDDMSTFIDFVCEEHDLSEQVFNLLESLFPAFNDLHPERPKHVNLQIFVDGFADLLVASDHIKQEEQEEQTNVQ